jgi:hypothetical protein
MEWMDRNEVTVTLVSFFDLILSIMHKYTTLHCILD